MSSQNEPRLNAAGNYTLGLTADIFAVLSTQPLDTVKTYVMSRRGFPPLSRLWHGTAANCSGAFVQGGLPFLVNGVIANCLFNTQQLTSRQSIINGVLTGVISSVAIAPFERVAKIHQLTGGTAYRACLKAVEGNGISSLFKAIGPIAVRDSIVFGTFFGGRKVVSEQLQETIPNDTLRNIISGVVTGIFAGAISAPADRLNVLMQGDTEGVHPTMMRTMMNVVRQEGVKSLWRGVASRSLFLGAYYLTLGLGVELIQPRMPRFLQEHS